MSKEEREKYDASIKVYRDTLATMAYAEEKGIATGMAEGLEKGREEGIKEGMKEGIKEGATNIARKMRSMGLDTASICEATGLTSEEVQKL